MTLGLCAVFFPVNMTHLLQTMDLVVNGPIKQNTRNLRCLAIMKAFNKFKIEYAEEHEKPLEDRKRLRFKPPKPDLIPAIHDLINLFSTTFKLPSFKDAIKTSMVATGTVPYISSIDAENNPLTADFRLYEETEMASKRGQCYGLPIIPLGTRMRMELPQEVQTSIASASDSMEDSEDVEDMDDFENVDPDDVFDSAENLFDDVETGLNEYLDSLIDLDDDEINDWDDGDLADESLDDFDITSHFEPLGSLSSSDIYATVSAGVKRKID